MLPPKFELSIDYAVRSFGSRDEQLLGLFHSEQLASAYLTAVLVAAAEYYGYDDVDLYYSIREYAVVETVESPEWATPPAALWVVSYDGKK